ncbi:MAG: sigma-70 family RNA polymerase sigma factor [Acidobacteria bacterium]|nr:sigma-70 family RNA polymerase sigma factor [Acidobacteriota bacterium]MBI3421649.1 sigma-70 family RNA polymerase sigma factor [Acidobacteriota bacterium]
MQPHHDEKALLARLQAGEQTALAQLYDHYAGTLYGLAYRITGNAADAEEVVLDAFTQAWRQAQRYDPARGSIAAWLVTIARSRALDRRRQQPRESWPAQPWAALPFAEDPEAIATQSEQAARLRALLNGLPASQRQVLVLAYFYGLSQHEIAAQLGEPLGTVKTRARLGMQKLRAWLPTPAWSQREAA